MAELIMLRLEGLLQSWGESAAWDNRSTSGMPTRSGLVGLIACAMGLERGDSSILELSDALTIGVRADRQGVPVSDFQTVQGMPKLLNAEGKPRPGNTIVTPHWYIQDASFLAVVEAEGPWRRQITEAFAAPVWCMYLGRKNCVPSRPVWDGVHREYANIQDALRRYPVADRADPVMTYEMETPFHGGSSLSRADAAAGGRTFHKRRVWRGAVRRDELCT